jgi:alkylation response protein AidB-like acyl-CoA dehydrogenase
VELRPSEDQQQLVDAFAALYSKESSPERVRAAEPLGFDEKLWQQLFDTGVVSMAVGEDQGGWGATLVDLVLVAAQHGRALGSAPLVEAQVAARLLARVGAEEVLAGALDGSRLVTVSPRPARNGVVPLVPAGAVATDVLVRSGDDLVLVSMGDRDEPGRLVPENVGSMPLADISLPAGERTVLASGPEATAVMETARDEWFVLTAAALAAMAQRCVEIGVDYTRERHAFGRPIGAFQGISHRLADSATAADGAELLARQAAWSAGADPDRAGQLAPLAFAFAAETARDASYRSLHFHGGYGFMLEYDIQLYWRRSRAWANVVMSPERAYRLAGDRRLAAVGASTAVSAEVPVAASEVAAPPEGLDFRLGASTEEFRGEIREFLSAQLTSELEERIYRSGVNHDPEFSAALSEQCWIAPQWPVELGGQGRDPIEMLVLHEELRLADAPTYGIGTTNITATVIRAVGTDEQQREILPRALSGEIVIVLGFTEPEAGSDLAAVSTKAVRDGDDWVIDGQKMFTTNAQIGDYAFLLARTDPDAPKHEGLTMFLVPLDQPGVEVQAVYTLSGERTNITFYNGVRVEDRWRLGEVDQGWRTLTVALAAEHAAGFGSGIERLLTAFERWAATAVDDDGRPRIEAPDVQLAVGRAAGDLAVSRLLQRRVAWCRVEGIEAKAAGPMSKLFSSEALEARAQEITEVMGPDALRSYFDPTAPEQGVIEHMLRFSLGTTIYGGTSEVHRNMIAQRGLGLPR